MSRPLRILLTVALALTLLAAIAIGGTAVLLGTDSGTRLLANQARNLAGGSVNWTRVEGNLLGTLRIEGLEVRQPGLDASVKALELAWQPAALLGGLARVETLTISDIALSLTTTPADPDAPPFDPGALELPLGLDLADATVTGLEVITDNGQPLQVERIELSARLDNSDLALRHFALRLPEGGLDMSGRAGLSSAMPVAIEGAWDWALTGEGGPVPLSGTASLSGDVHWGRHLGFDLGYRLAVTGLDALESTLPVALELTGQASGVQAASEVQIESVDMALTDTDLALSLSGRIIALDTETPLAELDLAWQGVQWPLHDDEPEFASRRGSARIEGTPSGLDLTIDGELLGGSLSIAGEVAMEPTTRWQLALEGNDLDPAQLLPDLPGSLMLSLQTSGELAPDGNPRVAVTLEEVRGSLADIPLQAEAEATIRGDRVDIASSTLASQGNTLQASGHASPEQLGLDFQLVASHPAALLPGAEGELSVAGSVSGSPGRPRLQARVSGDRLRWQDYRIASLTSRVSAGLGMEDTLELDLAVGQVSSGEQPLLAGVQLTGHGTTGAHQLAAEADAGDVLLRARLAGGPDAALSAWSGVLKELSVVTTDYGQWNLDGDPALALAADRASLGDACLQAAAGAGRICAGGAWTAQGASEFRGRLQALPLDLFVPAVSGAIDGAVQASLAAAGDLRATGDITLDAGEIRVDGARKLAHGGGKLSLNVNEDGLSTLLKVIPPADGTLEASARLPALSSLPLAESQPLEGSISAQLPDLSGFAAWVPDLGRTAGRLAADLQLEGSLADPQLLGALVLQDGVATVPMAGIELRNIELKATSETGQPGKLVLTGGLRSGPGRLALDGEVDIEGNTLALAVSGERLQVYNTPDARALLSPDLELAWLDDTLTLRGTVTVPEADITPKIRLSPAAQGQGEPVAQAPGEPIAPSADVIVVSENLALLPDEQVAEAPFRIDSRLRLELGNKVQVTAAGFVSRITGAVDFTNTPEQEALIPLANGRFSLEDGTFRAFGQDLEIETGQLIFANVPADQPEINLRAVRWIDNDPQVTAAGVLVTGPLEQPVLELFSRPQLETSEIQSYLLTGRSPRSRDNVLGIGTYVSRKVYVGYGYNMLERTSEFNSLFNISPRFGVGSSVGEADNNINMTITYEH